jgi:uncharacterized protein YpuA (DUF1002 family)
MKPKFKITEKKLFATIRKFLKKNIKDEMVKDFGIDYNDTHDRIVVNIFFDKKVENMDRGKVYEDVVEKLGDYFGIVPWVYGYYDSTGL